MTAAESMDAAQAIGTQGIAPFLVLATLIAAQTLMPAGERHPTARACITQVRPAGCLRR